MGVPHADGTLGPFTAAYSHPQALGQSRLFRRERGIVPLSQADTAGAAAFVAELKDPSLAAIADVYEERPSFEWRGLGEIDASGLRIREAYRAYDAEEKFGIGYAVGRARVEEPEGCACGAVMTGRIKPTACPQFGRGCTPDMPLGALMVSSEGACAAYWTYGGARVASETEPAE